MLTLENYAQGFLIDDEWMAGVTVETREAAAKNAGAPVYAAFIVNHATGDSVGYHVFGDLQSAIDSVNAIPRSWKFEKTSECGGCGGESGTGEGCGKGACRQTCQTTGTCELQP